MASIEGSHYTMIIRGYYTRYTCSVFLTNKSHMAEKFEDLTTEHDHGEVEKVWTEGGDELLCDAFTCAWVRDRIKHEKKA